jgi:hypothetical protein
MTILTATSPDVQRFLTAWHESRERMSESSSCSGCGSTGKRKGGAICEQTIC